MEGMGRLWILAAGIVLFAGLLLALRPTPTTPRAPEVGPDSSSETAAEEPPAHPGPPAPPDRSGDGLLRLTGIVRSADDKQPVPDAEVTLGESIPVRTRADGRFDLLYPPDPDRLQVHAAGFSPTDVPLPEGREDVEILLDRAGRLYGRVTRASDGTPVPGTRVWIVEDDYRAWRLGGESVTTDEEGRYEFRETAAGEFTVFVRGGGWVSTGLARGGTALVVEPGAVLSRDLLAEPAGRISGRVLDHRGTPVHAAVSTRTSRPPIQHRTESDEEGRFVLEELVPAHPYLLEAQVEGTAPGEAGPVDLLSGEAVEVEIHLPPPRWIDLIVLERGTEVPVAGAEVFVRGARGYPLASPAPRTDSRGHLRIGPLKHEPLSLEVRHPDHLRMEDDLQVGAAHSGELRIYLARGFRISGRAVLPDGTSLPEEAWGEVGAESQTTGWSRRGEFTDGRFRIASLAAGRYQVSVETEMDESGVWWEGEAVAEAGDTDVLVLLRKAGGRETPEVTLVVRVLDAEGHAVPAASLWVTTVTDEGDRESREGELLFGRGELTLDGGEGTRTVEVYDARSATGRPLPYAAQLAGPIPASEEEVTITLGPERWISGTVRDRRGGGVPDLVVEATAITREGSIRQVHRRTETASDGSFRLGGLWEGRYLISVHVPKEFTTRTAGDVVEAGAEGLEFVIERGLEGAITVVDPDGKPVAGASVDLLLEDEERLDGISDRPQPAASGTTGADGNLPLEGLETAATYAVALVPPAGRRDLLETFLRHVRPGDRLAFDPAYHVTASIADAAGWNPADLLVWGRHTAHSDWKEGRLTGDGAFTVGPFPEGEVELVVLERGVRPGDWGGAGTVVSTRARGVRLTFDPGRDLTVRVRPWPEGAAGTTGHLTLAGSERERHAGAALEGVFRFPRLPSGVPVTFFSGPIEGERYAYRAGIPAGVREVEIELLKGRAVTGRIEMPCEMEPHVSVEGPGFSISGTVRADGSFEVRGVPPGEWTVAAESCVFVDGHQHSQGSARITGDGPVVIRMSAPE